MSKPIVLVTGVTGFLGSHVVSQLLEQGYTVRGAVRPGKSQRLGDLFPTAGTKLQITEVASLTSDFTAAVQGVGAVIHCASPGYFKGESAKNIIDGAYHGTLNIVNTAIKAGIKKIIITGTFVSLFDSDFKAVFGKDVLTANSFGSATLETIDLDNTPLMLVYQQAKTAADKKVWEIAHANPDVDFTVILPPALFGPFVPNFPLPTDRYGLGTSEFVYQLITGAPEGPNTYPDVPIGHMVDIRDAAKAHILALTTAPLNDGRDKRLIISSKIFKWAEAAEVVKVKHPELAGRLPGEKAVAPAQTDAPLDVGFAKEVLGLTKYIDWEETILGSLDDGLKWEKENGVKV